MSMKQEILRAFLLTTGGFEMVTNLMFLLRTDGISSARKQHQELPKGLSDRQIKKKVGLMLLFGIAFFTVSLLSYLARSYFSCAIFLVLLLFAIYGVTEAICYKYWKTWGFACLTLALLLFSIFNLG